MMGNGEEFDGVILFNGQPMEKSIQDGTKLFLELKQIVDDEEIAKRANDVVEHYDQFIDADEVFNDLLEGE